MTDVDVTDIDIAVIGGSGFYELFADPERREIDTPYGPPSDAITVGTFGDRRAAFLPRHGVGHRLPAHRIDYRANIWALRQLGVTQVLAPSAVGSLRPDWGPGVIAVPDQIVDRTTARTGTFYDVGASHVAFADPYCARGRACVRAAADALDQAVVDEATLVTIDGPRFSTRAESRMHAAYGDLINMTAMPEAALARELGMCYTTLALVTDVDAGVDAGDAVHQGDVFAMFAANIERLRVLVDRAARLLPTDAGCACRRARDDVAPRLPLPAPPPAVAVTG